MKKHSIRFQLIRCLTIILTNGHGSINSIQVTKNYQTMRLLVSQIFILINIINTIKTLYFTLTWKNVDFLKIIHFA